MYSVPDERCLGKRIGPLSIAGLGHSFSSPWAAGTPSIENSRTTLTGSSAMIFTVWRWRGDATMSCFCINSHLCPDKPDALWNQLLGEMVTTYGNYLVELEPQVRGRRQNDNGRHGWK